MNKKRGLFITIEGIDGCGKSLMSKLLAAWLQEEGYSLVLTREPGGSKLGQRLRQVLLDEDLGLIGREAEALLFAADRAQHVVDVIRPALDNGQIVICDRYADSTLAYQGGGRGMDKDFLQRLNDFATASLRPDLTLLLNISLEQSMGRRSQNPDRMEKEDKLFYDAVASVYQKLAAENPHRIKVVDASRAPQEVFAEVKASIGCILDNYALRRPGK